ncbi:hypothetical protein POM88_007047 [Heracleum sosnowskyi]|uniref:CCHC-type domain-containing protein n=1 Tax=Heracleum sosnowskyi TaxID=360622 RepID=A0AAD8J5D2_9APIA|nr:hypothetical protein POM88_007047 [Heracleum sosnowskyi]
MNIENSQYEARKKIICNSCGKPGHIKKFCRSKFVERNASISQNKEENSADWGTCLSTETTDLKSFVQESALTSIDGGDLEDGLTTIDYSKDWIIYYGCSHHLTGDGSLLSSQKEYMGDKAIVTADNSIHPVKTEGNVKVKATKGPVNLTSVYHVPDPSNIEDEDVHDKTNPPSPLVSHDDYSASESEETHETNDVRQ